MVINLLTKQHCILQWKPIIYKIFECLLTKPEIDINDKSLLFIINYFFHEEENEKQEEKTILYSAVEKNKYEMVKCLLSKKKSM